MILRHAETYGTQDKSFPISQPGMQQRILIDSRYKIILEYLLINKTYSFTNQLTFWKKAKQRILCGYDKNNEVSYSLRW